MKDWKKVRRGFGIAALAAAVVWSGGCAGPSTRVLPREQVQQEKQQLSEGLPVLEEANPFYLQEALGILSGSPRVMGSDGEKAAVLYLSQMFDDYGYQVTRQEFQEEEDGVRRQGVNVCGVRQSDAPDADIVIVVGSHDTADGSPGAHADASGLVVMLETARLLAVLPTDTELRFVSVSGSCQEDLGVRHYLSTLSQEEIQRTIGVFRLGNLGALNSRELSMRTMDGRAVLLGELYNVSSRGLYLESVQYLKDLHGGEEAFVRSRIPALVLKDRWDAYEDGSAFDRAEIVNIDRLAQVVNVLAKTLSDIMSEDSPSLVAKSRYFNDLRDETYTQDPEETIPFGEAYAKTRKRIGQEGYLSAEHTDDGKTIKVYQYPVKWFGVDQLLLSSFYYREDQLEEIRPDADGAGVELAEMKERISSFYGEPREEDAGPNGTEYHWESGEYGLQVTLTPSSGSYDVSIQEYAPAYQTLYVGTLQEREAPEEEQEAKVMNMVRELFPEMWAPYVKTVELFTDGLGGSSSGLSFSHDADSPSGVSGRLAIDVQEVLKDDGSWRDQTDFVRRMLLWQGELLKRQDPVCSEAFAARFEKSSQEPEGSGQMQAEALGPAEPDQTEPSAPVQVGLGPGEAQVLLPDFAESYRWFVLTDPREEEGDPYGERIRFFYDYEKLVENRRQIRSQLRLK